MILNEETFFRDCDGTGRVELNVIRESSRLTGINSERTSLFSALFVDFEGF